MNPGHDGIPVSYGLPILTEQLWQRGIHISVRSPVLRLIRNLIKFMGIYSHESTSKAAVDYDGLSASVAFTRFLPAFLALYNAASAIATKSAEESLLRGIIDAMPTLIVT